LKISCPALPSFSPFTGTPVKSSKLRLSPNNFGGFTVIYMSGVRSTSVLCHQVSHHTEQSFIMARSFPSDFCCVFTHCFMVDIWGLQQLQLQVISQFSVFSVYGKHFSCSVIPGIVGSCPEVIFVKTFG